MSLFVKPLKISQSQVFHEQFERKTIKSQICLISEVIK
jgi:hypothetical protein